MSVVHAKCTEIERNELWDSLLRDKTNSAPWVLCGDFNLVVDSSKTHGGRPFSPTKAADFLSFISSSQLFDVGFSSSRLNTKLRRLKNSLQQRNKNSFGNVFQNVSKAEKILEAVECQMETIDSFEVWAALDRVKCSLQYHLSL